jgi:hypothetical protein
LCTEKPKLNAVLSDNDELIVYVLVTLEPVE